MSISRNTSVFKRIILLVVAVMLFNIIIPKQVHAANLDIAGYISKFLFSIERGIIKTVNNIFCDDAHAYQDVKDGEEDGDKTTIYISPETIIKGKFALLDPDIFKEITSTSTDEYYDVSDQNDGELTDKFWVSTASLIEGRSELRNVVAGWYYALRNFALVALLSILVYVGIRMIISTASQDKAKYKVMLKDWLVAICLVMVMHYIMIGALSLTSNIVKAIGTSGNNVNTMQDLVQKIQYIHENGDTKNDYYCEDNGETYTIGDAIAFEIILIGVISYTIIFAFKYLLRMMTLIFLILVAPITAITYPLDKISDGKAQAFNTWLQEFIYQVIIQPFHLLIYIVLVGSATTLASTNLFYGIMCFAVMIPSEKFIKQMFGFKDKLSSGLGAFAFGAVASKLFSGFKSGGNSGGNSGNDNNAPGNDDSAPNVNEKNNLPGTDGSEASDEEGSNSVGRDPVSGDPVDGDPVSGDPVDGDPVSGDPVSGDPVSGDPVDGDTVDGDQVNDNPVADPNKKDNFIKRAKNSKAARAISSNVGKHFIRKYGSTKIGQIGKGMLKKGLNKGYRGAKNAGKRAIKGATTLVGAAALGTLGLMFGKGKEMASIGAGLGSKVGGTITNKTDKLWNGVENITSDIWYEYGDHAKEKSKLKFKKENANLANNISRELYGKNAKAGELDDMLEKMYDMKSVGIDKTQYADAFKQADEYENSGMDEDVAWDTAMASALSAKEYSAKDFRDEKTMNAAANEILKQYRKYIEKGIITQEQAEKNVRRILNGAARMKNVKSGAILSGWKAERTIDVNVPQLDIPKLLGVNAANLSKDKLESVNELTIKVRKKYTKNDIEKIAGATANAGGAPEAVIDRFKMKLEYLENGNASGKVALSSDNNDVKREMMVNSKLIDAGVDKDDINNTVKKLGEKMKLSEKERAIEISSQYSDDEMMDGNKMKQNIEDYSTKKGVTIDAAVKDFQHAATLHGLGENDINYSKFLKQKN